MTLIESTVTKDRADSGRGGGWYNVGDVFLVDASLEWNSSDLGGGLSSASGVVTLVRAGVRRNEALYAGGGIYVEIGEFHITDGTYITENRSDNGGGVHGGASVGVSLDFSSHIVSNSYLNGDPGSDRSGESEIDGECGGVTS